MATKSGKTFWQRFKWWLYAFQWFFTAIGIYEVVIWMSVPQNRKNALIGAVIAAGFLLFGVIAVWRARAAKRKASGAGTVAVASAPSSASTAKKSGQSAATKKAPVKNGAVGKIQKGADASYSVADVSSPMSSEESDEARMRAIEEELAKHG